MNLVYSENEEKLNKTLKSTKVKAVWRKTNQKIIFQTKWNHNESANQMLFAMLYWRISRKRSKFIYHVYIWKYSIWW